MTPNSSAASRPWIRSVLLPCLFSGIVLSGCASMSSMSAGVGCLVGGAIGAIGGAAAVNKNKRTTGALAGAAVGCAVGLAATAVGKALNERQQDRQETAFQSAAQRAATAPTPGTTTRGTPSAPPLAPPSRGVPGGPQTIGSANWTDGRTQGGAAPAGAPVQTADGDVCVPMKEWAYVNGKYVDQEVQACRPVADTSGKFERVVPNA